MNIIFKRDIENILKLYKRSNKEHVRKECANDIVKINEIIDEYFPNDINYKISDEMSKLADACDSELSVDDTDMSNEIIKNINSLKAIYNRIISEIKNYDVEWLDNKFETSLDLSVINDFFKSYPGFNDLFDKVINEHHLFFIDNSNYSFCYNIKSINDTYIFVSLDDLSCSKKAIVHELSHAYQDKITYNDGIKEYNFLTEFMSILMELLFMDYYSGVNYKESRYLINNDTFLWFKTIFSIANAQLSVIEKHKDAIIRFKINDKYINELDNLIEYGFDIDSRNDLYMQFYAISSLCALTFYYQVKYGLPFDEVEKFYIKNNNNHDLNKVLNQIDMEAYNQYLVDFMPRKNKERKKR